MKRFLFHKSQRFILNAILIGLAFTACKKQTSDTVQSPRSEEIATAAGGSKPISLSTVYLKVTISDATGNKITGDGLGDYIHGVDNVRAELDGIGSFQFDALYQSKPNQTLPLIRWVNFNFNDPIGTPAPPFTGDQQIGNRMITNSSSLSPYTPIQNMTINQSQCITLAAGSTYMTRTNTPPIWRVNFHGNYEDISASPSAFAIITRISDTQWTITPGNCSISSSTNVGALRNGDILYGYYHMPFSITLTKL
jgi:hypothetical protein